MHRFQSWTRGAIEVLRAWQRHGAQCARVWPHLTTLYQQLRALPNAQQTHWRRRCKATLWGVALCLAASGVQPALADTITVDGTCTLVDAITTANNDTNTGNCVQTGTVSAADTIVLTVDTTLTAANNSAYHNNGLPVVSSTITIAGQGHTITRDLLAPDVFRLIAINSAGNLTIQDTTLSGGLANGVGGAVFNEYGQLRLEGCTVSGNSANNSGGGIYSRTDGSDVVSIVTSTITGNSASRMGGGVWSRTNGTSTLSILTSTISGNGAGRYGGGVHSQTYDSGTVSILDSTISGNSANIGPGGGVYSRTYGSSTVTVSLVNSTVSGNLANDGPGGGVWSRTNGSDDVLSIRNSTITGNSTSRDGGGIYSRTNGYGTVSILTSTITGNSAGNNGGGVYSETFRGPVSIVNSMVSGNSAGDRGGGVYSFTANSSTLSLVTSTITGNSASRMGGGVYSRIFYSGTQTQSIVNSTVSSNSAAYGGGSAVSGDGSGLVSIVNSTITGNSANRQGGGVWSNLTTVALHRSLIAGNIGTGNKGDEVWNYQNRSSFLVDDYNLFGHSGVSTADALTNLSVGATDLLATSDSATPTALAAILDTTLANNGGPTLTHALVSGSPAIDAAGVCGLPTDQRGFVRNVGNCDIGAYEFGASPPEVCGNCLDDDGDNKIDVADEDCTAVPLNSEKGAFSFKADPEKDQLSLNATFPLGPVFDPPTEGATVQFFDAAGQLACIQIPAGPVVRKPPGWKVKTGRTGTTWSFSDAKDGSLGDPTKDKLSVQCNTQQQECTVKLNVKAANIAGDATARNITTGVIIGDDSWKKEQGWQPKAKGKKLVTREE